MYTPCCLGAATFQFNAIGAGGLALLVTSAGVPPATATLLAGSACALLFALICFLNASKQLADSRKGYHAYLDRRTLRPRLLSLSSWPLSL